MIRDVVARGNGVEDVTEMLRYLAGLGGRLTYRIVVGPDERRHPVSEALRMRKCRNARAYLSLLDELQHDLDAVEFLEEARKADCGLVFGFLFERVRGMGAESRRDIVNRTVQHRRTAIECCAWLASQGLLDDTHMVWPAVILNPDTLRCMGEQGIPCDTPFAPPSHHEHLEDWERDPGDYTPKAGQTPLERALLLNLVESAIVLLGQGAGVGRLPQTVKILMAFRFVESHKRIYSDVDRVPSHMMTPGFFACQSNRIEDKTKALYSLVLDQIPAELLYGDGEIAREMRSALERVQRDEMANWATWVSNMSL
ncbi:hypothetical protein F4778DRAFT_786632 [Xylariomycetidae sp. FL2044]|nr:hypothetical protein F4778DRAFT_786632 [Xylariomycetidae sp. FL2044]